MNEHRRFDEDDARIDPVPQVAPAVETRSAPKAEAAMQATAAPARLSMAARLLTALVLLMVGAGLALVGAPRLAPMLPATVAAWLSPAQGGGDAAAIERLRTALAAEIAAARSMAEAAQGQAAQALAASERAEAAATRAADLAAQPGVAAPSGEPDGAMAARLAATEATVTALEDSVAALSREGTTASDAAIAALRADLSDLDQRLAAAPAFSAPADLDDLRTRLAALEEALARDVAIRERALAEAGDARRAAAVTAVLADIDRAMALGLPFPEAVEALRETAGVEPPAVLVEAASRGAPTREALQDSFAGAAHRAVAEALADGTEGESGVSEVLARVQARFTGIPAEPTEGPTAPAVLSRARHHLLHGRIEAALGEIASLPAPAQAAMADWTEGARLRDGADAALTSLRATIGRGN